MHFQPDLFQRDLPKIVPIFIGIIGQETWRRRIGELENTQAASPIFEKYVAEVHALELELAQLLKRKKVTGRFPKRSEVLELNRLLALIRMVVGVYTRLGEAGKRRVQGMLIDALKSDRGFNSLEHEMGIAAQLMRKGFDVEFVDIENSERFDFLARLRETEVEVECKTISYDLGRKVHRRDFNRLANKLWPSVKQFLQGAEHSHLITLTVDDRLDASDDFFGALLSCVKTALISGECHSHKLGVEVQVDTYEPSTLEPAIESHRNDLEDLLETHQFHLFLCGNSTSVVAFVVRSKRPDQVLSYMYRQFKNAADQFTGSRPAILCVHIQDIEPHQWIELQKESGLQLMTHRYLDNPKRSHIHTVAYNSKGVLQKQTGYTSMIGPVFFVTNMNHPKSGDQNLRIFAVT
jgi:hypothetical protein|tara:strand:- start:140 stop:1360 length:1221 start_codon:yes stop_codon:yes gene_type:complete